MHHYKKLMRGLSRVILLIIPANFPVILKEENFKILAILMCFCIRADYPD